ncbi:glycosyltransferase family 58 protein [Gonapodya prolifera JEL478]|uniref:Dol-P-Man:Man(5)GlcNAc(2)-PP-Dol alpha-1,3-mannosyltransferase n=1 Tax=Gonapodya prolifera (strain JEL478) TaxID=1344416 RepID=A0A139A433_GONPJ|nr:glycosyltransferase family 58 protein [Gonapodya prolifera JEL478]|eukprot:KXS11551.1 glycosyltransferase family 58 protein [Gonapodya prolifera JEL478]
MAPSVRPRGPPSRHLPSKYAAAAATRGSPSRLTATIEKWFPSSLQPIALYPIRLLTDETHYWQLSGWILAWEVVLGLLVINFVQYTEIDWSTYMQQVSLFMKGERRYDKLEGDTGPVVYPAGYIYLYTALSWVTKGGSDIRLAQYIFLGLYLVSLWTVLALLKRSRMFPQCLLPLLTLSKRLHSIYILRLFNDPWAMLFFYIALLFMDRARWRWAAAAYSVALSIKMNILLFAPAFAVLNLQACGIVGSILNAGIFACVQVLLSLPFVLEDPRAYLARSFDFSRVFLYKWTVNWRFVPEETFLDGKFASTLLVTHAVLLLLFSAKWIRPHDGISNFIVHIIKGPRLSGNRPHHLPADHILSVMFTCNLIGVLCSRSLHYQFWSWYAWQVPYVAVLGWSTPWGSGDKGVQRESGIGVVVLTAVTFFALEYCWNVYPATPTSSFMLFVAHLALLALCYAGRRWGVSDWHNVGPSRTQKAS